MTFLLSGETFPLAAAVIQPVAVIMLCALAGLGTFLLLPRGTASPARSVGGALLVVAGALFAAVLVRAAAGESTSQTGAYFWIFSILAIASAVRVVTHQRPVYSALYFVLTIFASAGLFVLLAADFLAAALVIIYAGAILVTYVFVIMLAAEAAPGGKQTMANQLHDYDAVSREPLLASVVGFSLLALLLFVVFDKAEALPDPSARVTTNVAPEPIKNATTTQLLGITLFTDHVVSLQLAGMILTLSMVGAIVIARRRIVGQKVGTEVVLGRAVIGDDNPHSIPVLGTQNPRHKAYPET